MTTQIVFPKEMVDEIVAKFAPMKIFCINTYSRHMPLFHCTAETIEEAWIKFSKSAKFRKRLLSDRTNLSTKGLDKLFAARNQYWLAVTEINTDE